MKDADIKNAFAAFQPAVKPVAPAAAEAITAAAPVRARLNYTDVGVCPYCNQPTKKTMCCGQEVFLCEQDRFVAPLPNSEQG